MQQQIPETSGGLARASGVSQQTIAVLADEGLLDHVRTSNGIRLFVPGQAPKVKALIAARAVARGRRPPDQAAA